MDAPHIVVTDGTGSVSLLLRRGSPVSVAPTTGFNQVVTAGDTAQRTDQRTPQVIWTDQRGGMGERFYLETEGLTSFTAGNCDVRFPNMITLVPQYTGVGTGSHGMIASVPSFAEYLGITNAYVIVWAYGNASLISARRYDDTAGTWNTVTTGGVGISLLTGYAYFNGYYLFATTNAGQGLYTSTDGVTWANSAKAKACIGLATHDNKVWTFNNTDKTLDFATDPTAAHASWGTSAVLYLHPGEIVRQVAEWRDRVGRAAVYVVTTRRLIWYDEDADAFLNFFQLGELVNPTTSHPRLAVSPRDGSAFLTLYDTATNAASDRVYKFSGVTEPLGPNQRGGLPLDYGNTLVAAVGNSRWMFFAVRPRGAATNGSTMVLNEQGGWGVMWGPSSLIVGVGYGQGKLFTLLSNGLIEQTVGDSWDTPLNGLTSARYQGFCQHEFAYTDGGTPNIDKQALWVTINSLDHTSATLAPGLAGGVVSGATCAVQYRTDRTGWTTAAALTAADTFPKTIALNGGAGVPFRQFKLKLSLDTNSALYTPVIVSTALSYIRMEAPKFSYTVVADLSERDHPLYRGQDIAQLRARIAAWAQPGSVVRLDFAGGDWGTTATTDNPARATSVPSCTVQYSASEDPEKGPMYTTLVFNDVSAPA